MLKTYTRGAGPGGSSEFWNESWATTSLTDALRFCEYDPLAALFRRYLPRNGRILEGGCGPAHYVAYYRGKGYDMVGVDFAHEPLKNALHEFPMLPLCSADVSALPFRDGAFAAYYSGGVVEHFEEGPERALGEAKRVLGPGGVLIISVPYLNAVRRIKAVLTPRGVRAVSHGDTTRAEPGGGDAHFFQFVFKRGEFRQVLKDAGFRVVLEKGTHVLWGAKEIPWIGRMLTRATATRLPRGGHSVDASRVAGAEHRGRLKRWLKHAILAEDDRYLPVLPIARVLLANMMVYVCVKGD